MRHYGFRWLGTGVLLSSLVAQFPSPAFAGFTPPVGGGKGATVHGVVVDPPRNDPSNQRGEVVSSTNPNSLWILAGAGVALALLIGGDSSGATPVLGDCADLFDDLFENRNGEATSSSNPCAGRKGAMLTSGLITAAFTLPDPGKDLPNLEARLAQSLLPTIAPQDAVRTMHQEGTATLERLGQPAGTRVLVDLDEYLMPGKTYDTTFTVNAVPGMRLDEQLYLVAADLTQAGTFPTELGVPFAVPVNMDALRSTGTWSYTTGYTAEGGAYFIDAYVSSQLPRMLKTEATQVADVIEKSEAEYEALLSKLRGAKRQATIDKLQAEVDLAQAKYLWLLEWSRYVQ